jgi:uncharacterized protein YkwD
MCLVNLERARHGLAPLRENPLLAQAGARHAQDMVRRRFFGHTGSAGTTVAQRVRRSGYLRRARRWAVGEALAFGRGAQATSAAIVAAWLRSPAHRGILLDRRFRELGVGIALGMPVRGGAAGRGATYAAELGVRS